MSITRCGVSEAKTHLSRLLREIEAGEGVLITRRGRPVARLVPTESDEPRRRRAIEGLKALERLNDLAGLQWEALRAEARRF
jgi:prevent-host-death family protein